MHHSDVSIQYPLGKHKVMSNKLSMTVLTPVTHKNEVFDNLIEVKRHDTGEVGTLLCSHCCKWPKELKEKATWLEGCYTPATMKGDNRLLMGYHPSSITQWKTEEQAGELILHINVPNTEVGGEEVIIEGAPIFLPLYTYYDQIEDLPRGKFLFKLWDKVVLSEAAIRQRPEIIDRVCVFYRQLSGMAQQGLIPWWVISGLSTVANIANTIDYYELMVNGDYDFVGEVIDGVEVYADALVVVNGDDNQHIAIDIDSDIGDDLLVHQQVKELLPGCLVWKDINSTSCEISTPKGKRCIAKSHEGSLLIYTMQQKLIAEYKTTSE